MGIRRFRGQVVIYETKVLLLICWIRSLIVELIHKCPSDAVAKIFSEQARNVFGLRGSADSSL